MEPMAGEPRQCSICGTWNEPQAKQCMTCGHLFEKRVLAKRLGAQKLLAGLVVLLGLAVLSLCIVIAGEVLKPFSTPTPPADEALVELVATNDSPTRSGEATTLSASVAQGNDVVYTWDIGDGNLYNGATVSLTFSKPGTYVATVTAKNSVNTITATTTIEVKEPITELTIVNDSPTALGQPTSLGVRTTSAGSISYQCDWGDGVVEQWTGSEMDQEPEGIEAGNEIVKPHTYSAAGEYTVLLTASNLVSTVTITNAVVIEEAITNLNASYFQEDNTVSFAASVATGGNPMYIWDLGDGNTRFGSAIIHEYSPPGRYMVTITAYNSVSTETATIAVPIKAYVYLPMLAHHARSR